MIPDDIDSTGQVIFRIVTAAATPSEVERFLSSDFRTTAVTLFYRTYSPTLLEQILARAQGFAVQNGARVEFRLGGGLLGILAAIHTAVETNYWLACGVLLCCAAAGGLYGLRSLPATTAVVLTCALSQLVSLILLWLAQIDLNMFTLPVFVASFGIPLLPTFLIWSGPREATAPLQGQTLTTASFILASSAAIWLFSPLRLQAEMGFFLLLLGLISGTLLPLQLSRPGRVQPEQTVELDSAPGSASIVYHESAE